MFKACRQNLEDGDLAIIRRRKGGMATFRRNRYRPPAESRQAGYPEPRAGTDDGDRLVGQALDVWAKDVDVTWPKAGHGERQRREVIYQQSVTETKRAKVALRYRPRAIR